MLENLWLERGSAATLVLAMVTQDREQTSCRVLAVGDCVAIVSAADYLESFPLTSSNEFSTHTTTVKTRTADIDASSWTVQLPPGSMLALASDGIGRWLLLQAEKRGAAQVHNLLQGLSTEKLPDVEDDVTLLILDVESRAARWSPLRRVLARIGS